MPPERVTVEREKKQAAREDPDSLPAFRVLPPGNRPGSIKTLRKDRENILRERKSGQARTGDSEDFAINGDLHGGSQGK